ncbi:hypothetical protein [Nonomuraea sp. NPDC023979]|uniref:hypothetical protein n=1 Tax=Nonomuraea sp. NPDC023979 TaxID=3154796 RepID=UPI00340056E2
MAVGDVTGIIGAASGILALGVASWAARSARRSADEAAALRAQDAERLADEREARHDQLAPVHPGVLQANFGTVNFAGQRGLFVYLTLPRSYRVRGRGCYSDTSWTDLTLPGVLDGGVAHNLCIESWTQDQTEPRIQHLLFDLWPPLPGDAVSLWSCPCGRPSGETLTPPGHWQMRVDFKPPPRSRIRTMT